MAIVLAISSQVARGHVGLSAAVPALQRLGHEVIALPTVLLSNHLGHGHAAGTQVEPAVLVAMLGALAHNGGLASIDAVLTGYLPSAAHVAFARETIAQVRVARPDVTVVCDPVLGDDPHGLYLDEAAARAIGSELLPLAGIATPNRFELAWLSGRPVASPADTVAAARLLPCEAVLATSIPASTGHRGNVLVEEGRAVLCTVPDRAQVPHGTGDLMAALFLGHLLGRRSAGEALALAVAGVEAAIAASVGSEELMLAAAPEAWARPKPRPAEPL